MRIKPEGSVPGARTGPVHVAIAQVKPRKADMAFNLERLSELFAQVLAMEPRPDVLVLPETALTGYFLEGGVRDVALNRDAMFARLLNAFRVAATAPGDILDIAVGFYELASGAYYNSALYGTVTSTDNGTIVPSLRHVHQKFFLPTYGVFDEQRFVARGRSIRAFDSRFGRAAMLICEDVWHSVTSTVAALDGAQILYVLSASPGRDFGAAAEGNIGRWRRLLPGIADEHNIFVVYAGLVGFEGGKGFTGSSCIVDPWAVTLVQAPVLDECVVCASIDLGDVTAARAASPLLADLEAALPDIVLEMDSVSKQPYQRGDDSGAS